MTRYYADTYALIKILRGNLLYKKYASEELVTSEFNLLELAYALTRDYGKEKAAEVLRLMREFLTIIQPTYEDYVEVLKATFRLAAYTLINFIEIIRYAKKEKENILKLYTLHKVLLFLGFTVMIVPTVMVVLIHQLGVLI